MKKSIRTACLVMLCASTFAFANGQTESTISTENSKEPIEISYWNIGTTEPDKGCVNYAIDQYNKSQSDYYVKSIGTQGASYKQKIVIAMSSGKCPDMYTSWSGGPMNEYVDSGFAQPLDDLVAQSKNWNKLMPAAVAQASYNGHVYAYPFLSIAISGIFYNKEIFTKYDLEVPKTVTELEHVCDVLEENGVTPFSLANKVKWTGSMYFMNLAARMGGLKPFQDAVAGTGSFEDSCFIYAGQKIQEWVKKGYFAEGVNSLSYNDGQSRQLLYQGKAAMELMGSWYTSLIASENPDFYQKLGWFAFPKITGSDADSSIQIGTIGNCFVSFNCTGEKLKNAFACVDGYMDDAAIQYGIKKGKLPPIKGVEQYVTDPVVKQVLSACSKASSVQLWYDQYLPPAVAQTHLSTCQQLFGLSITPEKAAQEFQASMQEYLNNK